MSKIIWLDAGHGGSDPGAVSGSVTEKSLNLSFILKLGKALKQAGFDVRYTRVDDVFVSLDQRCKAANASKADLFLSIHADAAGNADAKGPHVIHSIHNDGKLANLILQHLPVSSNGRGAWTRTGDDGRDYYAVIRGTAMQALILERGFMTNPIDLRNLQNLAYTDTEVERIVVALSAYYGVSKKPKLTSFADVPSGHWAEQAIKDSFDAGIMSGYSDGTFGIGKNVTREELASVVAKLLKGGV